MKTVSIVAFAAALALTTSSAVQAQALKNLVDVEVGSGSNKVIDTNSDNDSAVGVGVDLFGDKTVEADASILGLNAKADADLLNENSSGGNVLDADVTLGTDALTIADIMADLDLNGDGVIDGNEAGNGSNIGIDIDIGLLDTNGDGVIDDDELEDGLTGGGGSGTTNLASANCGIPAEMQGQVDLQILVEARNVVVVEVPDCVRATGNADDIQTVLAANTYALRALRMERADLGDVVGANTSDNAAVIFVSL